MLSVLKLFSRRLISSLIVLFGVSLLIFAIARVIPGDPARIALGPNASKQAVEQLRDKLHLNDPFINQYGYFISDLMHGDLGTSLYTNRPVTTDIKTYLPATLELVIFAGLLMVVIGLPLGMLSARYQGSPLDHIIRLVTIIGVSAPSFVWAVIFMLLFAYFMPLFPIAGRISEELSVPSVTGFMLVDSLLAGQLHAFFDALWHLILPAFALALAGIGQAARLVRSNMVETYKRPYIEMAQSYGIAEKKIARRYAFRPSMIPSLTILGLDFAAMLGNAFLVEAVYAWPGLSRYGVEVILRKDLNAIIGTVMVIAAMFLIVNLIVDLLVSVINPRIRLSGRAS